MAISLSISGGSMPFRDLFSARIMSLDVAMIYLKTFTLAGQRQEELYINSFGLRCFDSYYPLEVAKGKAIEKILPKT